MSRKRPAVRQARERKVAEIAIEGPIGDDFWDETAMSAARFRRELKAVQDADGLRLLINSPGGDTFDGISIYNQIRALTIPVTVEIEGEAFSAASFISMAGDSIVMREGAMMMIHNPWGIQVGNASEMRAFADILDKVANELVGIYARRTGLKSEKIREMLDADTFMNGTEAVELGFADKTLNEQANLKAFRLHHLYDNVPDKVKKPDLPAAELQQLMHRRLTTFQRMDSHRLKLLHMEIEQLDYGVAPLRRAA